MYNPVYPRFAIHYRRQGVQIPAAHNVETTSIQRWSNRQYAESSLAYHIMIIMKLNNLCL